MQEKLLVVSPDVKHYKTHLLDDSHDLNLDIVFAESAEQVFNDDPRFIEQADIILGVPNETVGLLSYAKNLKWVQSTYAGIEPFFQTNIPQDFLLTGVKNLFGTLMSEYVFGYILAIERNIIETHEQQKHRQWQSFEYRSLKDINIGICGFGSIGQDIAKTAQHFKMNITALNRSGKMPQNLGDIDLKKLYSIDDLPDFIQNNNKVLDYIVITLPSTSETKHTFSANIINLIHKDTTIINVGRGASIDTFALINALKNQKIKMAVLDVFEQEPLDINSPLWQLDNVIITPHNAAVSFAKDIVEIFIANYHAYKQDKPMKHVINRELGY